MDRSDLWTAALCTLSAEDRKLVAFDGQHKLDVLSDLGHLVASAKDNSIKKRWRFHRPGGGQIVILRDLFSKIVVWIDRFKEIGDIVVQYDPVHAALPWAGVRFLLQLAVNDINKFAFIVEGAETIAHSISRYATFEEIYLGSTSTATSAVKGLEESLVKLYIAILAYLVKAKKYFEEHTSKRMAKAVITSQSDFEALLRNIERELANVDRHAGLVDAEHSNDIGNKLASLSIDQREMHTKLREILQSIDSPICRMTLHLDGLEDQLKHSERVEILRWLSAQPYLEHHQQIKKQALPGSGQWLLQDPLYIRWYKQSMSSLLWLHGRPGSGKSTLVSLVIEDMIARFEAGQSARPVYFYCTRSAAEPERSNPNTVLASILRQLSCVQPGAPILSPIIDKYKKQGEGFKSKGLDLDDSVHLIIRLLEDYSMTTIVVDALDECDPQMRQSLLDAFERILKESVGLVKIFVSSRNDQDIVCTLRNYPNMSISSNKNTGDIAAFVAVETMRLVKCGQLLRNSRAKETMTASIIEQVSDGADGMFRWASLQLDVLRALKRDEDVRARLGRLPPKLEQLYLEVYETLISDQGPLSRAIIDNALKWLLCAQQKLRASDFLVAVAANLDTSKGDITIDDLLDLCNNFVVYDDEQDVFRFAHLSVREFLEKMPDFVQISCCMLTTECCLLQIIASSSCPNTENLMSEAHLLRLRGGATDANPPSRAGFLNHANSFWMIYCHVIPLNDRLDDTNFGRIFYFFLAAKLGFRSPLKSWVQWYCSRVLYSNAAAELKLQECLTGCSDSLSISFIVAAFCGFSEIVTSYLEDRGLSDETIEQGLVLAAIFAQYETFDIIRQDRKEWTMSEPLLLHMVRYLNNERLASLLEGASDTIISNRVFAVVSEDKDHRKMNLLLNSYPDLTITKGILEVAAKKVDPDSFRLVVARAATPVISDYIFESQTFQRRVMSVSELNALLRLKPNFARPERIGIIWDRARELGLTPGRMTAAADCKGKGGIGAMLDRLGAVKITEEDMVRAADGKGKGGIGAVLDRLGAVKTTEEDMVRAAQGGRETFRSLLRQGGKVTDRVLDEASRCDVHAWQALLEQGYGSSINVKRLKLAAMNQDHGDAVLSILLEHADDTKLANDMAGLIRDVARHGRNTCIKQLLDRAKDIQIPQEFLLAAFHNPSHDLLGRVRMLLERSSKIQITEDMLVIAASDRFHGRKLVQMLLEREGDTEISEYVLMAAACNIMQGYRILQLLLEQNSAVDVTDDMLICAVRNSSPDIVLKFLECSEAEPTAAFLLQAAAANRYSGGEIMKLLLARAKITEAPEAVFSEAVSNGVSGMRVILELEDRFGQLNVTEKLMAKCVRRAEKETIDFFLSRVDPAQITDRVLMSALSRSAPFSMISLDARYVHRTLAEKSFHTPITTRILVLSARYTESDVFRFLWNRARVSPVPEEVVNAAAKNCYYGNTTMSFLLHEVDLVEIGNDTLMAIVANRYNGRMFFDMLIEQGLEADKPEGVLKTLSMNGGVKAKCSLPTPLLLKKGLTVTESMFRTCASCGNEPLLEKLSSFCELESTPEKWFDIARLYNAARRGKVDLLHTLLRCGVEPNVASPDGVTPLVVAAEWQHEEAVQLLLSAGALPDGGPNLNFSPLCRAAKIGLSDIVEILVNAGASLDFRDDRDQTPAMLAKSMGHIFIFKYLEQCRREQETRRQEMSSPA